MTYQKPELTKIDLKVKETALGGCKKLVTSTGPQNKLSQCRLTAVPYNPCVTTVS